MILFIPNPRKGQTGIKRRDSNCQGPLRGSESTVDRRYEKTSRVMKMFYVKTALVVTLVATFVKTHQTVHLKNW